MSEPVTTETLTAPDPSGDVLVEVKGLEVHFPIKSGLVFDRTVGHVRAVDGVAGRIVAVGPHGSTTPRAALRKLGVAAVAMGECEETVARIAGGAWDDLPGLAFRDGDAIRVNGGPRAARFVDLPPLAWPDEMIARHRHHHHRFDDEPQGPGAEVEASRGCPYSCTFCAKENFRDRYRRFTYIDRVITAPHARGQGHARRLYEDLFTMAAAAGYDLVVCEVNERPPNPGSAAFHGRLGFEPVGRADIHGGSKTVRYLARPLAAAG